MMQRKLAMLVAGDRQESMPKEHWRTLSDYGFVNRRSISCVGFCRGEDSSLLVVFPKAFAGTAARLRLQQEPAFRGDQVFRLIRIFRKVLYETKFSIEYIDSTSARPTAGQPKDPVLEALEAAVRLRADYHRNGLWLPKRASTVLNTQTAPVSWPATMRKTAPLLDDGFALFLETVHHKRVRDYTHLFHRLHLCVLRQIFALTGERQHALDSLQDSNGLAPVLRNPAPYLRALHRQIFTDRGRSILGNLEAYLGHGSLDLGGQRQRDDTLSYAAYFEILWEFILAGLFAPDSNTQFLLPQGHWLPWPPATAAGGITPRADLVLERPVHTIMDAKDYRVINGSPLLGSPADHYKQVIYRAILEGGGVPPATNILAFPTVDQGSLFVLKGCHLWDSMPRSAVFEICVDYDLAVRRWLGEITIDVAAAFQALLAEIDTLRGSVRAGHPGHIV